MGCMGSVLQFLTDNWGTVISPAHLALSSGMGWPLMLTWGMGVRLFLPVGHNPEGLLGVSTYCLGNTSHLVSSHAQQLFPSSRSLKSLSLHYSSFIS